MSTLNIQPQQFKTTSRYLQEKLTEELGTKVKLSTAQEALSRALGHKDYHSYQQSVEDSFDGPQIEYANGDIKKEIESLRFCLNVAQDGYSTAIRIRKLLLHLYNNTWTCPDLGNMKNFDEQHTIAILNVIALNSRPFKEIHTYIDGSQNLFRRWARESIFYEWLESEGKELLINSFIGNSEELLERIEEDTNDIDNLKVIDYRLEHYDFIVTFFSEHLDESFSIEYNYEEEEDNQIWYSGRARLLE